jgi:hypothetical protein
LLLEVAAGLTLCHTEAGYIMVEHAPI